MIEEGVLEAVNKDFETAQFWYNKDALTGEEMFGAGSKRLKSFVIKLNNGSLLLYAPVRIQDKVGCGDWLASLGPVTQIVVASSYHTLNIQAAEERYPDYWCSGSGG